MNNFPAWIDNLKQRGCTINTDTRGIQIDGPTTPEDWTQLARHRHTLTIAAAGTHTEWWNHILGRPTRQLQLHDIPTATDDPDAFACSCCGQPAAHLDWQLLPWCDTHA